MNDDKALITSVPSITPAVARMLEGKTPAKFIKERPVRGGGKAKYIELGYVQAELNKIFKYAWSWKIIDKGITGDDVWVQGELIVPFSETYLVTKTGFGGGKIKKDAKGAIIDLADDYKAAAADALKKAASQFGIAADVYAKEDYYQESREAETPLAAENSYKTILMKKFFAVSAERGFTSSKAEAQIKDKYKITHMEELTIEQLNETITSLVMKYKVVGKGNMPELFPNATEEKIEEAQIEYYCKGPKHNGLSEIVVPIGKFCSKECEDAYYPKKKEGFERDWNSLGKS